ncbi:MAG: glycosyltransferase family 4 protein [Bacteroidota bacterium]
MAKKRKLAIVSTHPIQYNAPWFRLMSQRDEVDLKVFYTWSQSKDKVKDKNFGMDIKWDLPLLEGYDYMFVDNTSKNPGSHHFFGMVNPSLISEIKAFKPDAILVFGWNFKSHLKVLRYFRDKTAVWFRGDSTLIGESQKINFKIILRRKILGWIYRNVDLAFYVGAANKAYFLAHGIKDNQLIYAPHAVDNERFFEPQEFYQKEATILRKKLGFKPTDLVVLFAGKFEPKKQPELLLKAIQNVNQTKTEKIKALFVGTGVLEASLKLMAQGDSNIQFLGFQNQQKMPIIYRVGSILCLPSKGSGETWGLAVNEAMACARPIIVSDEVGCSIDLVKDLKNGFIFKSDSKNELETVLENLEIQKLKPMGAFAQDYIKSWSFLSIVDSIENTLKS